MLLHLGLVFGLLVNSVLSFAVAPTPPTEDPFYTPPSGFENDYKLGDIIAHRPVPGTLASIIVPEKVQNAWQLLIRSEDPAGNPNAIVTTLIQPFNANSGKLLSYQIAEDNTYLNCAPSYELQVGSPLDTTTQPENILIIAALDQGWYVNVPDYEGPKSSFASGRQEGKGTLDSIRGVLKSGAFTGLQSQPTTALWGYSGGTMATGWAATLAPTYAPELKFVGAAIGGIVPNVTAIVEYLSGTLYAGFGINGIVGIMNDYPGLNKTVTENLKQGSLSKLQYVQGVCLVEVLLANAFTDIFSLVNGGKDILYNENLQPVLQELNMIQDDLLPNIPLFFYHAVSDEIAPVAPVDSLWENWCSRGVSVDYQVDLTGDHITEAVLGSGKAFVWLKDRMNGKKANSRCNKSVNLSNALDINAIIAMGELVVDALFAILQANIGGSNLKVFGAVG